MNMGWRTTRSEIASALFRWSGILPFLIQRCQPSKRAAILVYHNPTVSWFEPHMAYLSRYHSLIGMDRLARAVASGDWTDVPRRAVVVTLDDGHARNRDLLELFVRYRVEPTIYLCSQIVGTTRHFWWTHARGSLRKLKRMPNSALFWSVMDHEYGFVKTRDYEVTERQALSETEIKELASRVTFGSHGRFHALLPMCSEAEAADEIMLSRVEVHALTGRTCDHFSYPNGDYTVRDLRLVREAGYLSARTTEIGWVTARSDVYQLPMIAMPHEASLNQLRAALGGYTYLAKPARAIGRRHRRRRGIQGAAHQEPTVAP